MASNNRKYVDAIIAQVEGIPRELAAETAVQLYSEFVYQTAIDSGQAALNWRIGWTGREQEGPELLWGYGDMVPRGLAGYKWTKPENEYLRTELASWAEGTSTHMADTLGATSFTVYNPIEEGAFTNFSPGTDEWYAANAFANVDETMAMDYAIDTAERILISRHSFLRFKSSAN